MIATTSLRGKGSSGEPSEPKNHQLQIGEGKSFQIALNKRTHHAADLQKPDSESINDLGEPTLAATPPEEHFIDVKVETFRIEQSTCFPCPDNEPPIQLLPTGPSKGRNVHAINTRPHGVGSKGGNQLLTDRDSQSLPSFEPPKAAKGPTVQGGVIPFPVMAEFELHLPATTNSCTDSRPATGPHLLQHTLIPVHTPEVINSIAICLRSDRAGEFTIRICQRRDELDVMIYFNDADFLDKFQGQRDQVMAALRNENLPVAALNLYDMGRLPLTIFPTKKGVRSGLTLRSSEAIVSTEVSLTSVSTDTSRILRTITDFIERDEDR